MMAMGHVDSSEEPCTIPTESVISLDSAQSNVSIQSMQADRPAPQWASTKKAQPCEQTSNNWFPSHRIWSFTRLGHLGISYYKFKHMLYVGFETFFTSGSFNIPAHKEHI